jgi:poly(A)-specific ribonuclease
MDVTKTSFYPLLLDILTDISESYFVAFDLELSGVPVKQPSANRRVGRPSLQERYQEVKEAAEKYSILQIGLTCVREDVDTRRYISKPYNFELSPLIDVQGLDVERDFAFSTSAVDFLKRVGFDFSKPFNVGVPYLSREEAKQARERHENRQKKDAIADLHIKETDVESIALLQRIRDQVDAWLTEATANDYLNIGPVGSDVEIDGQAPAELTRYEKRLVHQLVRAEYPNLVTFSKRGFVQVVHFDAEREARISAGRKADLDERIGRQKGFRWVMEALLGNNIGALDLTLSATDPITGDPVFADIHEYRAKFNRAHANLRNRPRVLVGHNCFLDLVYLYKAFIGSLPKTVEEFQTEIHNRWPTIIDTKYMATHNCGDINPASSLEEIARQLAYPEVQLDVLDELHSKYKDVEVFHEAGFDSYLTAQVAVRLSMKLEHEGAYVDDVDELGQGGVKVDGQFIASSGPVKAAVGTGKSLLSAAVKALNLNGTAADPNATPAAPSTSSTLPLPATTSYKNHRTASPLLSLSPKAESFVPSSLGATWKAGGDATLAPENLEDPFSVVSRAKNAEAAEGKGIEGGMPRFGGDFWRVYGNRLRVFGTEEGVCALNGHK